MFTIDFLSVSVRRPPFFKELWNHIEYCTSEKHSNADGLSCVSLPETTDVATAALSEHIHALIVKHFEQALMNAGPGVSCNTQR